MCNVQQSRRHRFKYPRIVTRRRFRISPKILVPRVQPGKHPRDTQLTSLASGLSRSVESVLMKSPVADVPIGRHPGGVVATTDMQRSSFSAQLAFTTGAE